MDSSAAPGTPEPQRETDNIAPSGIVGDEPADETDDDLDPPLDLDYDVPEADAIEQRQSVPADDDAWEHE